MSTHIPHSGKAPNAIIPVRHRDVVDRTVPRIQRYWKENETGILYEVTRFMRVIGAITGLRVVIRDAKYGRERSLFLQELQKDFTKYGNSSSQF